MSLLNMKLKINQPWSGDGEIEQWNHQHTKEVSRSAIEAPDEGEIKLVFLIYFHWEYYGNLGNEGYELWCLRSCMNYQRGNTYNFKVHKGE